MNGHLETEEQGDQVRKGPREREDHHTVGHSFLRVAVPLRL